MKTFSRRVEDVFSVTFFVFRDVFLKTSCKHVWKTSCKEVLKMPWRHIWKTSCKHALKTSWKMKNHYAEDVLENMENKKCLLGRYSILGKNLTAFNQNPLTILVKRFILDACYGSEYASGLYLYVRPSMTNHIFKLLFKSILCQQTLLLCWIVKACSCKI